jgi:hypothetical protein
MHAFLFAVIAFLPAFGRSALFSSVIAMQEPAPAVEPTPPEPEAPLFTDEELFERGKKAFVARDFQSCISELESLVLKRNQLAMILTADAMYALGDDAHLAAAQKIYFQIIYEYPDAPFRDHCYFRIAEIYLEQDNPFEGKLYYKQMIKKFPESRYRAEAGMALFKIAEDSASLRDLKKWAGLINDLKDAPEHKAYVRYISFIFQKTRKWDKSRLKSVFTQNRLRILRIPDVLQEYANRFKTLKMRDEAKNAFLDMANFQPEAKGHTQALLEVAIFEKESSHVNAAVFLLKGLMETGNDPLAKARAMIQVADMIAAAQIGSFSILGKKWNYSDLQTAIRFSALPASERAPFVYRQALLQAVSDPPSKALLTLRQLITEYQKGPFSALYRDSYKEILHQTIAGFYRSGRYWDLDEVYQRHRFFLEQSTETQYPHMMAKAYLKLGLTAPARKVYEALWREKEKVEGFELAFEEPFADYFLLLNDLSLDDFLSTRLPKYITYYGDQGHYYNRYLLALTGYETRQLKPLDVVRKAKTRPVFTKDIYDARRLQLLTLAAQRAQDWAYADELFKKVRKWPQVKTFIPFLDRASRVYEADYLFRIGNYFLARKKYLRLQVDPELKLDERIWADLQLARLYELKQQVKESLTLYAQVALNAETGTESYAAFARHRMEALAFNAEVKRYQKGELLGQN